MEQEKSNKLETKPVAPLLISLALPMILAELITLLYNMVDRIYIGHMENSSFAMGGIGLCAPLVLIITAFSRLFGQGGAPLSAICMGQKRNDEAEHVMANSFTCILISSVIITAAALIFAEPLLRLFGASDNTLPYALDYMLIYALGTVFVEISVGMNYYINTQGFTRIGMGTMLIGALLNIALDPLFIFTFNMGVKGAALATVLSQAVSGIWVLQFLFGKKTYLKIRRRYLKPEWKILKKILSLGITPFFQSTTESAVNISFNTQLYLFGGDLAVSSLTILSSLFQIIQLPMQGVALGAQPIISYNYGALHFDRVKKSLRLTLLINTVYAFLCTLAMVCLPGIFVRIFTSDTNLLVLSRQLLPIYAAGGFFIGIFSTYQQAYNALGKGLYAFLFAFARKIVLLIPLIFLLPNLFPWGAAAVILAEPISDIIVSVSNGIYFQFFAKKTLSKTNSAPVK